MYVILILQYLNVLNYFFVPHVFLDFEHFDFLMVHQLNICYRKMGLFEKIGALILLYKLISTQYTKIIINKLIDINLKLIRLMLNSEP